MSSRTMQQRDYRQVGRSAALAENGMIATSHPLSSQVGLDILKQGGNAIDAAVAAIAVQSVVEPMMTGVGGDAFAMIKMANMKYPMSLNGSGWSPKNLHADSFDKSLKKVEETSVHSVTIPGCVDAWCHLVENYGLMSIDQVLKPAIDIAEQGYRVTGRVALDWHRYQSRINLNELTKACYLPGGFPPKVGDKITHMALAKTLRQIAKKGRKGFYEGEVAADMVRHLQSVGGAHQLADFAEFASFETNPMNAQYRDHQIYECPPNGQGLAALIIARLLDGLNLKSKEYSSADRIHLLAEASKIAYSQRDALFAENINSLDYEYLLNEKNISALRNLIQLDRAAPNFNWQEAIHKDTVCLSVVDRDRNTISLINSIYTPFGSGIYSSNSGVLFQNRGCGFSLKDNHPNQIGPRKRPLHTIIPGLLMQNEKAIMPFGVMGGHYQATGHIHFLSQILDLELDPQLANEQPRSFAFDGELSLEPGFSHEIINDLANRGHKIVIAQEPIGGCQAIYIDHKRGLLVGSSDHRKDGMALGY